MTERISHEAAANLLQLLYNGRLSVAEEETLEKLELYRQQQQALEADTRAEHEAALKDLRDIAESTRGDWTSRTDAGGKAMLYVSSLLDKLTALQAELASERDAHGETTRNLAEVFTATATERARAEEAAVVAKAVGDERDNLAAWLAEEKTWRDGMTDQLAAANARAVATQRWVSDYLAQLPLKGTSEESVYAQGQRYALECLQRHMVALSTAPQASTEQASPSPAVGEEEQDEGPDERALPLPWEDDDDDEPAQPAPSPAVGDASACHDDDHLYPGDGPCNCGGEGSPMGMPQPHIKTCPQHPDYVPIDDEPAQPAPGGTERCEHREEDEDGVWLEGTRCWALATRVSCKPFVNAATCDEHKCRCSKPLLPTPAEPGGAERWVPKVGERVRNKLNYLRGEVTERRGSVVMLRYDDEERAYECVTEALEPDPTPAEPQGRPEQAGECPPGFRQIPVYSDSRGTLSMGLGGLTTIRACQHCGVLIAGGPTACVHCVRVADRLEGK